MIKSHGLVGSSFGRLSFLWIAFGLLAGFALAAAVFVPGNVLADEHVTGNESVVLNPTEVDFQADSVVWIYGSGFVPGTEVMLLVTDRNGVVSDITSASSVYPLEVNEDGAFATAWTLDRYTHDAVGTEGLKTIWVVDSNFNDLATAPIAFCRASERAEEEEAEAPAFCSQ